MLSLFLILWLLFLHYVGDFLLQTEAMALNKHHDNRALASHVLGYLWALWIGLLLYGSVHDRGLTEASTLHIVAFVFLNGFLHWVTDWFTSRWNAELWALPSKRAFFRCVGYDQLVHVSTLVITAWWLLTP